MVVAVEMETAGDVDEARTMLTSRSASWPQRSTCSTKKLPSMSLKSGSNPVFSSRITSLMHGGGVMGLRSLSPKPHIRARTGCCSTTSVYVYFPSDPLKDKRRPSCCCCGCRAVAAPPYWGGGGCTLCATDGKPWDDAEVANSGGRGVVGKAR